MNFPLALFFRQVLVQVSNPDRKAPFRKITVLVLCTLTRARSRGRSGLCVFGAENCGRWQKSFMLTGQIKRGATGEAEGNGPKTRREPNSVTGGIIELEALTFF